jgi:3D (Asp-Asp-Asp) domain-containing protein
LSAEQTEIRYKRESEQGEKSMKALLYALILLGLAACGPNGMRAAMVHSSDEITPVTEEQALENDSARETSEAGRSFDTKSPSNESHRPEDHHPDTQADQKAPLALPAPQAPPLLPAPKTEAPKAAGNTEPEKLRPVAVPGTKAANDPHYSAPEKSQRDQSSNPSGGSSDFVSQGTLVPSIYYTPMLFDNDSVCPSNQKVSLRSSKGISLMMVCPQTLSECKLEGSCRISQGGMVRSFNVAGGSSMAPFFEELGKEDCFFGYGVGSVCLDPFYTVAADLRYYKPGDVIYVPALVGGVLPNGEKHTGYLVVRDRGGGIHGPNRFDFFSGTLNWKDPANLFGKLNLGDKNTRVAYYSVRGESAKRILQGRAYPKMPVSRRF